jgi:hypothetical protein
VLGFLWGEFTEHRANLQVENERSVLSRFSIVCRFGDTSEIVAIHSGW